MRVQIEPVLLGMVFAISGCGGHVLLGGDNQGVGSAKGTDSGGAGIDLGGGAGSSGASLPIPGNGSTGGSTGSSMAGGGVVVPIPPSPVCFRAGSYQAIHPIFAIAYAPNGNSFATGHEDAPNVRIWDAGSETPRSLEGHSGTAFAVAFSPDSTLLAAGGNPIGLWNASSGHLVRKLPANCDSALSIAFSNRGNLVATSCAQGDIQLWRVIDGSLARSIPYPTTVYAARFSPDDTMLVTAASDNAAKIWRVSDGTEVRTLVGHTSPVSDAAFSPDGNEIATTTYDDRALRIWRTSDGALLQTVLGHAAYISHALWMDADHIVTNDWGGTVNLWVRGGSGFALSCGFSGDAKSLGLAAVPRRPTVLYSSAGSVKRPAGLFISTF